MTPDGSALGLALHAVMQRLGGDAALIGAHDDDGRVTPGRIARVGKDFVIVEQLATPSLAHTFGLFRIGAPGAERFRLCPERCLVMLSERRPKGWHVQLMQDPAGWWADFRAAIATVPILT